MSGQLHDELHAALAPVFARHGYSDDTPSGLALREGLVEGLKVLAERFGPKPARELPTEPGSVILVSELHGEVKNPPVMLRLIGIPGSTVPWWSDEQPLWHGAEHIGAWTPALVVPDDEHGPAAALRRIADVGGDVDVPADEARDLMKTDALEALASLAVEVRRG